MGAIAGGIDITGKSRVGRSFLAGVWPAMIRAGRRECASFVHEAGGLVGSAGNLATNENETVAVALDGQLANREQFLAELVRTGEPFRPRDLTDAELVLRLYGARGSSLVSELRGSFTLAVLERRPVRLLLVRDPLGTRPLKFFERDGLVLFATESRALLQHPSVTHDLDLPALGHYLTFGFVPAPYTGMKHMSKVPAGHYLHVDPNGAHLVRHWRPRLEPESGREWDPIAGRVEDALVRNVPRHVRPGHDPDSAVLLDSSPASAVLAWVLRTFGDAAPVAVELVDPRESRKRRETPASVVARHLDLDLQRIEVTPPTAAAWSSVVHAMDEPLADPWAPVQAEVFRDLAARYQRIYLPDGYDVVFAGYDRYGRDARRPGLLSRRLLRILSGIWPRSFPFGAAVHRSIQRPTTRFLMRDEIFCEEEKRALLSRKMATWRGVKPSLELFRFWFRGTDRMIRPERFRMADLVARLPDQILAGIDATCRIHGLEPCFPFLDPDLVQVAGTLPPWCKASTRLSRQVLGRLAGSDLPAGVLGQARSLFASSRMRYAHLARDIRSLSIELAGPEHALFHPEVVRHVLAESGRHGARRQHALLVLELWRQARQAARPAPALS